MKNILRALNMTLFAIICLSSMVLAKTSQAQAETVLNPSETIVKQRLKYPLYVPGKQLGIAAWLLKLVDDTRNSKNQGARLLRLHQAWTSTQIEQTYPETAKLLFEAWLSEFAKAPGDIQIFFAGDIVRRASEMRRVYSRHFVVMTPEIVERQLSSEKMLRGVFQPLKDSEVVWMPNEDAVKSLKSLLSDIQLPEDIKRLLQPYLENKELPEIRRVRAIMKDLTNFDVVPKAPPSLEVAFSEVDELRKIYSRLNDAQKRCLAGDILFPLYRLQKTELKKPVEKLLWEVFDSIDNNWFDPGSMIACNLSLATTYYWQKKDFASVAKIERKALAMQESNDVGSYACATRQENIANAIAETGDAALATIEFLKAKKLFLEIAASRSIMGLEPFDSLELKYIEKRLAELKGVR